MLRSVNKLKGYSIRSVNETLGTVSDFYFDDKDWVIRYLIADTGKWLPGRKVLIAPSALGRPDWKTSTFPVLLTKEEIEQGPSIDEHKPVSRQHELELVRHYGWTAYWQSFVVPPAEKDPDLLDAQATARRHKDPTLRSVREVVNYRIQATDGEIGHVEDFVVDDENWTLRYMVVDTRNWLPGKKVLVSPQWISRVGWPEKSVHVDVTQESIKASPEFKPEDPINREYETQLYDYYGRPAYWL